MVDKFCDGTDIGYDIRKKELVVNSEYKDFFGYDIETIKMLSPHQFETFMRHKKTFEDQILDSKPIIITTVGKATTRAL